MTPSPRRVVQAGYDALGKRYAEWSASIEGDLRDDFVTDFARRLPDGAHVLDLGCGAGVPSTRVLAERFEVVGVDCSQAQLRLARQNVPGGRFIHADISDVRFEDESFEGVTALYSISHVPREEHAELFHLIAGWLRPGGLFLATLGAGDSPGSSEEWLGVPMFFSAYGADVNRRLLRAAGFELLVDEVVEMREPEGSVSFLWVLAKKAGRRVSDPRGRR